MSFIKKYFGPSTLIAAAFIGPGTLTTCTLAGSTSGYKLIWAMVFSIVATVILQEMSARLGFVTRTGLGEALHKVFDKSKAKYFVVALVISAIGIGNAAYESGNIAGTALGLELLFGPSYIWPFVIGIVGGGLLLAGKYQYIEKLLIVLVMLMSLSFLITVIAINPDLLEVVKGLIPTSLGNEDLLLAVALIGTTIVPYNLFLHASIISKKWGPEASLHEVRRENTIAIVMGGMISLLIIITAAGVRSEVGEVKNAADLAMQLQPVLGNFAKYAMGFGLFAAGLTSTLTAPLATAYAVQGITGKAIDEQSVHHKCMLLAVLAAGLVVVSLKINLITIVKFAQITNALLLPIIAGFLVYICNKKQVLGEFTNSQTRNITAAVVILICLALSLRTLIKVML